MKVITLLNEKGGVGKTSTTATVGAGLAILGYKVLVIDTDPQGSLTTLFNMRRFAGLNKLLTDEMEWNECIAAVPPARWAGECYPANGVLHIVPGHKNLRGLASMLGSNFLILRERLEEVEDYYDVVLIDTLPTPSVTHGLAYLASDAILFVTELEFLSMVGLKDSIVNMLSSNLTRKGYGINQPIHIIGIQPNKVEENTKNHRYNKGELLHTLSGEDETNALTKFLIQQRVLSEFDILPSIHKRTVWRDTAQAGHSIFANHLSKASGQEEAEKEAWKLIRTIQEYVQHES